MTERAETRDDRPVGGTHAERIRRSFSEQAAAFEDARVNRPFATGMQWLLAPLAPGTDDLVLDVATGTGQAARALAPGVRVVIALDATQAMLDEGHAQARRGEHRNIVFQRGDAARLPFLDASFDIVVCRFAVHHFEDPAVQVAEMARCLRAGGRLALADLVAAADPPVAAEQNRLERLRDPSHVRALSCDELAALARHAGLAVETIVRRDRERPLEPWLTQAASGRAAADEIRARLRDELAGGAATGLCPRERDGELRFTQRFASVIATAAPG